MNATLSRDLRVAVVGATGVIGSQLADLLAARGFPFSELKLFASERGAAETVTIGNEEELVTELTSPADLAGFDLAFLAASQSIASEIIRARPAPILIDLSTAYRKSSGIPLAAPGLISREILIGFKRGGVFGIPHPCAYALAAILGALEPKPAFAGATLMMGASTAGKIEVDKLMKKSADLLNARLEQAEDEQQLAFNLFPDEDEANLAAIIASQLATISDSMPPIELRIVRAPIFYGTALSIIMPKVSGMDSWRDRLRSAPGLMLVENERPPSVIDPAGAEAVAVQFEIGGNGASLWCVIDNARIAAMCAVWAAENLISNSLLS